MNEDGEADGEGQIVHVSGDKKYLVDETNQQVEHLSGTVSDVMVSVTINQAAADGTDAAALYPHVARAAGIAHGRSAGQDLGVNQPLLPGG